MIRVERMKPLTPREALPQVESSAHLAWREGWFQGLAAGVVMGIALGVIFGLLR